MPTAVRPYTEGAELPSNPTEWHTRDEQHFIAGLGLHRHDRPEDRLEMLKQYRRVMPLRHDWGHMDRVVIERFVDNAIILEAKRVGVPVNGELLAMGSGVFDKRQYAKAKR